MSTFLEQEPITADDVAEIRDCVSIIWQESQEELELKKRLLLLDTRREGARKAILKTLREKGVSGNHSRIVVPASGGHPCGGPGL